MLMLVGVGVGVGLGLGLGLGFQRDLPESMLGSENSTSNSSRHTTSMYV